ncbi:Potassium efflux system KefA protein / Small-conductance mechanosensitive channel [hydrothermal vent metagenome]|uniref:Potassium efflux system KefA protein / Small-conductance mechanosensitive channel n=1 Tax=hydrothermal vent metagenome TaxID=652676 RepID=A0A3B1DNI5_9ZZZZ
MENVMDQIFLGNPIKDYIAAVFMFLFGVLVIRIVRHFVLRRLRQWAQKTKITLDDFILNIIRATAFPLVYLGVFYMSIHMLKMSESMRYGVHILGTAIVTLVAAHLVVSVIQYVFETGLTKKGNGPAMRHSLKGALDIIRVVIWGLAIIFFLDNLGFKISAVIAGLGIGGVAVALAAQAVLGDLFSYVAILFDRPFEIGDFVIVDDYMGTVEHIGIKTTRINSLGGEQLVFSNTDLTNSRLRNYRRMKHRRVVFNLGVTYQTSRTQLKEIPEIIEGIIKKIENITFDRAHFLSYGDFSLNFEIVYYVQSGDYNKYMDVQQKINFAIHESFEKYNIEFAYPTQTVYINKAHE